MVELFARAMVRDMNARAMSSYVYLKSFCSLCIFYFYLFRFPRPLEGNLKNSAKEVEEYLDVSSGA